jgi:hypothetical protein
MEREEKRPNRLIGEASCNQTSNFNEEGMTRSYQKGPI